MTKIMGDFNSVVDLGPTFVASTRLPDHIAGISGRGGSGRFPSH